MFSRVVLSILVLGLETNFDEMTKIYSIERYSSSLIYFYGDGKLNCFVFEPTTVVMFKSNKNGVYWMPKKKISPNTLYSAMVSFQLEMMWVHWKKKLSLIGAIIGSRHFTQIYAVEYKTMTYFKKRRKAVFQTRLIWMAPEWVPINCYFCVITKIN